jgi:NADPH-dependent glutamate synthase beta subunit-like oxidoreductase
MKRNMAGADAKTLRFANEFRRRVNKRAAGLKTRSPETERARFAVLAVSRRLQEMIATLETRRGA